jgi:hypothetical protein
MTLTYPLIAGHSLTSAPRERIEKILLAVQVVVTSPMIGRPARSGKRELIIGRIPSGYVALY